ncbi:D-aminoacyl-tRNA deacylase [Zhongshania aliphaticivorans]|uniref:D-aminoacyl-tRNA deacylase n=1 Tax=Zhongshania aliphaticivorans TaxID=1470434 RepID=A0A5S9MP19_9GAMM|nr:D-aminoacyl-tRNA deacylase [Zhongshania aliphaticivorans]CAA0078738.1 D-aminoacyl-tRNA deacylase [Zhongshania aliphaticivorans]CAA0086546.1 D-aminoacyl-tRNA deacylase [Zhongshania aliphaticivorans]
MKALLQRVKFARVEVDGECVGEIAQGLLVFLGLEKHDDENAVSKMMTRLLQYRIFSDHEGKMNQSVTDVDGGVLLVSQFTLAADTRKGRRPGFSLAAEPQVAQALYEYALAELQQVHGKVASGKFGADMQVSLLNDGPVTFMLES